MKVEEISIESNEYPEKLRNIYNPPLKLYVLGNRKILKQKGIAIVGSRNATEYGKNIALKMSKELSENGIHIISGLAIGIDTYAHIGNLKVQNLKENVGKTIAVLGSGIDKIYPEQNKELARKIIETGGCIISEYSCRYKCRKKKFSTKEQDNKWFIKWNISSRSK